MADPLTSEIPAKPSPAAAAELHRVDYRVGDVQILSDISLRFRPHRFNVVLGPNGAGKSSLLKVSTGLVKPTAGEVAWDGRPLRDYGTAELARSRAVLSQRVELAFALPVREVVMMGRYPHYGRAPSARDREIVARTLDLVDMRGKSEQTYSTLSGGEQQKVQLARVLSQIWTEDGSDEEKLLFLDEPIAGLDVHYQIHILDIARELQNHRCTVVAVLHDLNIAMQYGNSFFMLSGGRLVHETEDPEGISRELIEQVYGVRAYRIADPATGHGVWRFSL